MRFLFRFMEKKFKICTGPCGRKLEENEENFEWRKDSNKFRNHCRDCIKLHRSNYFQTVTKERRFKIKNNIPLDTKPKIEGFKECSQCKQLLEESTENFDWYNELKAKFQSWCKKCVAKYGKEYRKINKAHRNKINNEYKKKRTETDIEFKLRKNLSMAFYNNLRSVGSSKGGHSISIVINYTMTEFKEHIESQWKLNWNWENHGVEWQIDHIIPLSYFKCKTMFDPLLKVAWSLENLRPLSAKENLIKRDKMPDIPEAKVILAKIELIKSGGEYKQYIADLESGVYDKYLGKTKISSDKMT